MRPVTSTGPNGGMTVRKFVKKYRWLSRFRLPSERLARSRPVGLRGAPRAL